MPLLFIFLGLTLVGFLLATPSFLFKGQAFIERLGLESAIQQSGSFGSTPSGVGRYLFTQGEWMARTMEPLSIREGFGTPFVVWVLFSLGYCFWFGIKNRESRYLGIGVASLVGYLFFSTTSKIEGLRFLLPFLVMMTMMGACLIVDLSRRVNKSISPVLVQIVLLIPFLLPNIKLNAEYVARLSSEDSRVVAVQWILSHVGRGEKVLNFMYGPALPSHHYEGVQWAFADYRFQVEGRGEGPSLERLKRENIHWVVWNDYYTHQFLMGPPHPTPSEKVYLDQWKKFYEDLKSHAHPSTRTIIKGEISPTIEVFYIP